MDQVHLELQRHREMLLRMISRPAQQREQKRLQRASSLREGLFKWVVMRLVRLENDHQSWTWRWSEGRQEMSLMYS